MTVRVYKSTDAGAPVLTGEAGKLTTLLATCLHDGIDGGQAGAGWTVAYTGSNELALRAEGGTQAYLSVQDNAPGAGGTKEARTRGYEVMSDIATGTGPFPTTTQLTNGIIIRKSATADATARPWILIADNTRFYLFIETGDSSGNWAGFFFGDILSFKNSTDAYCGMIIGRTAENVNGMSSEYYEYLDMFALGNGNTTNGHYISRNHLGTEGALQCGKICDHSRTQTSTNTYRIGGGSFVMPYPAPVDGGLHMSPLFVTHVTSALRGKLPGCWAPLHNRPLAHGTTFSGTGALSGKTFMAINASSDGQLMLETSDTWS